MIRVIRPAVAMSIQDLGRIGHASKGYCRSGAMDRDSLVATNRLAGAAKGSAGIELGPSPCALEILGSCTLAFGGAPRDGAPWWSTVEVKGGDRFELSSPRDGLWSYISVSGGVDSPVFLGSRSTCVRESVGNWMQAGDVLAVGQDRLEPQEAEPLPMSGQVRVYGDLPSRLQVGVRVDRMGYEIVAATASGAAEELSEPTLPGFVQALPSGGAFILMAEAPTLGGYPVPAVIHEEDLRLVAQTPPGAWIDTVRL